eukprot:6041142-Pyramimonas_sp.AAC.1
MQPLICSEKEAVASGRTWLRNGINTSYYQNNIKRKNGHYYYTFTCTYQFPHDHDTVRPRLPMPTQSPAPSSTNTTPLPAPTSSPTTTTPRAAVWSPTSRARHGRECTPGVHTYLGGEFDSPVVKRRRKGLYNGQLSSPALFRRP